MGVIRELTVGNTRLTYELKHEEVSFDVALVTAQLQERTLVIQAELEPSQFAQLEHFVRVTISEPRMVERLMGVVRKSHGRFDGIELQFRSNQQVSRVAVTMQKLAENAIRIEAV